MKIVLKFLITSHLKKSRLARRTSKRGNIENDSKVQFFSMIVVQAVDSFLHSHHG